MCLFFGDKTKECSHAECQIVTAIRSLNSETLFDQVATHQRKACRAEHPVSISELV